MQNQEKIIQAIAAYLEENTFLNDSDIYAPEITFGIVKEYPTPTHVECCKELADQINAAIAPHMEAGAGLKPTKFEKDHLPDDVKLSFHKGVGLYQCIQNYELGVLTKDEFIGDIRKVEADFK